MKKAFLFIIILSLGFNNIEAKKKTVVKKATPKVTLANEVDSMSYALGINLGLDFGNYLKSIPGGKSNKALLLKGFEATLNEDTTVALSKETAQDYFRNYITKAQTKDADLKKAVGEKFLAENKLKEGVQTTPSGLQFLILKSVDGEKPQSTDTVKVHYTGSLIDGKVFDSSVQRGEPIEFPLNGVIPGWSEGVQLMTIGSKYKFFIPYQLAYGDKGIPQAGIPPYAPLTFEVELLEVKKFVPAPEVVVEEIKPEVEEIPAKIEPVKKQNFFSKIFKKTKKQKDNSTKESTTNQQ